MAGDSAYREAARGKLLRVAGIAYFYTSERKHVFTCSYEMPFDGSTAQQIKQRPRLTFCQCRKVYRDCCEERWHRVNAETAKDLFDLALVAERERRKVRIGVFVAPRRERACPARPPIATDCGCNQPYATLVARIDRNALDATQTGRHIEVVCRSVTRDPKASTRRI